MSIDREPFGRTCEGIPVERFVLANRNGLEAELMTYGATLVRLLVPDARGERADVVLGCDTLAGYESSANPYFGCIVGRTANRIARAEFELDGEHHELTRNEGRHHLHGGRRGLARVVWRAEGLDGPHGPGVRFIHESPAGDEGYPGTLSIEVVYSLTDGDELRIDYAARADRPTPVSPSHHSYWNLAGEGTILGHRLRVAASRFTPVDAEHIPTGAIEPVAGTALDLRTAREIGDRIRERIGELATFGGYDHNFVLDAGGGTLALAAQLEDPASGRALDLLTTEPGLQVYTGNDLGGLMGKGGRSYVRHAGVCLEAQGFPDAVHHARFPSVIVRPGEVQGQTTLHRFRSLSAVERRRA